MKGAQATTRRDLGPAAQLGPNGFEAACEDAVATTQKTAEAARTARNLI